MSNNPVKNWRRQQYLKKELDRVGTVVTWTLIYVSHSDMAKQTPYPVVLVEFENGDRGYGQLVNCDTSKVSIGMKVRSTLRVVSPGQGTEEIIGYGLKFIPLPAYAT